MKYAISDRQKYYYLPEIYVYLYMLIDLMQYYIALNLNCFNVIDVGLDIPKSKMIINTLTD